MSKRLLKVSTVDGELTDQWLEDFGSFTNHFMIKSMADIKYSQTLWMEYENGEYLAREINADPLFAHDSGWMDSSHLNSELNEYIKCTYENGCVVFEDGRGSIGSIPVTIVWKMTFIGLTLGRCPHM